MNLKVKFLLKKFEISLKNGEYRTSKSKSFICHKNLLHLLLENMELNLFKRPVENGFKVNSSLKSIQITGSIIDSMNPNAKQCSTEPILVEPERRDQDFMNLEFEQNPSNALGHKRISFKSKSLRLTYHATTINNVVYFFRSEFVGSKKLAHAALKKISDAKERSVLFMKNNLGHIQQMDLNVEIQPSYLVVPFNGVYNE